MNTLDSEPKNVLTNIVLSQLSALTLATTRNNKNAKQEIKKYTLVLRESLQNKDFQKLFDTVDSLKLVNAPDNWKELVQSGGNDEQFWEYFTNNVTSDLLNLENKLNDSKFIFSRSTVNAIPGSIQITSE
jgi:hypothetical protein